MTKIKGRPQSFPIVESDIERWSELYPAVDVRQSIRNLLGWLEKEPSRKPATHKGARGRVIDWLKGDQDRGGTRAARASPGLAPWEAAKDDRKKAELAKLAKAKEAARLKEEAQHDRV